MAEMTNVTNTITTHVDTEAERAKLAQRVVLYQNNVIVYDDASYLSEFTVRTMFGQVRKILEDGQNYFLLIDLTTSRKPSALIRAIISEEVEKIKRQIIHCSVYSGKNKMINLLAKFSLGGLGFDSYTISSTLQEALNQFTKYGLKEAKLIPREDK